MKNFKVTVDGQTFSVQVEEVSAKPVSADAAVTKPVSKAARVDTDPKPPARTVNKKESGAAESAPPAGSSVPSPMPGSILEIRVEPGDTVKEGDVLLILEAMKMENEVTAPQGGTISQVLVKKGDAVNSGDPLVNIA